MKPQTHLKLFLREHIENWKYVDTILFLIILLIWMGYTDPCDRCAVDFGMGQMTCKEAFLYKIGLEENEMGLIIKKDYAKDFESFNLSNISYPDLIISP